MKTQKANIGTEQNQNLEVETITLKVIDNTARNQLKRAISQKEKMTLFLAERKINRTEKNALGEKVTKTYKVDSEQANKSLKYSELIQDSETKTLMNKMITDKANIDLTKHFKALELKKLKETTATATATATEQ